MLAILFDAVAQLDQVVGVAPLEVHVEVRLLAKETVGQQLLNLARRSRRGGAQGKTGSKTSEICPSKP